MDKNFFATADKRVCPKCGSDCLKYQMRSAGIKSNSKYYHHHSKNSLFFPSSRQNYSSKRNYKSVALCQNCGYCFEPYPEQGVLYYFLLLCLLPFYLAYMLFTSKWFENHKKHFFIGVGIVVGFEIILLLIFALVEVIA